MVLKLKLFKINLINISKLLFKNISYEFFLVSTYLINKFFNLNYPVFWQH